MRPLCARVQANDAFSRSYKARKWPRPSHEWEEKERPTKQQQREREGESERKWGECGEKERKSLVNDALRWARFFVTSRSRKKCVLEARVYIAFRDREKNRACVVWCSATSDGERVFTIRSGALRPWNIHADARMKKKEEKRSIDTRWTKKLRSRAKTVEIRVEDGIAGITGASELILVTFH